MSAEMIAALEALHSPSRAEGDWTWARCNGCDTDGWEAEAPDWPCRTAKVLWPDPDEQDAVLADWHEWADPQRAAVKSKFAAPAGPNMVPEIWTPVVESMLRSQPLFTRMQEAPDWTI